MSNITKAREAYGRILRYSNPMLMSDDVVPLLRLARRRMGDRAAELLAGLSEHCQGKQRALEPEQEGLLQALRYTWGLDGAPLLVELLAAACPYRQLGLFP